MVDFDYPEHFAKDAASAIALAEQLKVAGEYDLFRGQRHTFDIIPSALRAGVSSESVTNRLNQFAKWVHDTPDLSSLHGNQNAIIAVAQHYGLPTPFLDFSYSPSVAGFFATDGGIDGDIGTIICIKRDRFKNSWSDINDRYHAKEGVYLTDIVEVDVKNLWRLQAQQGLFIRSHVDSTILEMFSFMLHIYFPQNSGSSTLTAREIYPDEKSHLEVLLDQYMLIESYPERDRALLAIFSHKIEISEDVIRNEIKSFFKSNEIPPQHNSWESEYAQQWLIEPDERFGEISPKNSAEIHLPSTRSVEKFQSEIETIVLEVIKDKKRSNYPFIHFSMKFSDGCVAYIDGSGEMSRKCDKYTLFSMSDMVNVIYSGMRYLPYGDHHIARAIARYATIARFGVYKVIKNTEGVEFSGAGVRGRGFCNRDHVFNSLRSDFFSHIKSGKLDGNGKLSFRDTLFSASYIKSSYIFESFIELFVEDLIPSQAAIAVEGLVIGLNPMRLTIFGES